MPLKKNLRQMFFWVLAFTLLIAMYQNVKSVPREKQIPYSEFKAKLKAKEISTVLISPGLIKGEFKEGDKKISFKTISLSDPKLIEDMETAGVGSFSGEADKSWITSLLLNVGWILIFVFLWWFLFMRQAQMGGKQAMGFGKSKAKQQDLKKQKVTFKDVAGCEETKEELSDIVDYLKNPKKYRRLGGELPKGVLLYGPPGTGKTLLARAIAGEAGVPFFTSSGSEFVEMFVGVGASRVRDLFERAKKSAPAIVFVDELDAVGRSRFAGIGGGHDEREQTLNQMLVELDGFEANEGIILIGATNRPDVLDTALLRPGRFDRRINVPVPDIQGRLEILKVHSKKVKLAEGTDLSVIARHTPGFVGADLANIVNEAAILASKKDKKGVEVGDFEEAIEKMIAGPQRRSRIISDREKKIVAYHEAGHALVARSLPGSDPVHKISIIPRGPALGYTLQLPLEDKYLTSKTEILNKLCVLLGGRAAEELVFSEITTGAQDDLSKVTNYAQKMVLEFGMSDKIGPISLKKDEAEVFLGRDIMRQPGYSNETAKNVDDEVTRIVAECHVKAREILSSSRSVLDAIAARLIEKEVVDASEMEAFFSAGKSAA
ncbi:MAG: cell division protein FtsH [Elusimicrobia bacterium GWC2_51_8]|nr:MAG: cell division protein FtsH [Elusimicrobia bacterium GWA2_51_34]OGR65216.1 MAG: cell division protein FtsH [Elusimicrobia bacterium GWC2_51_8]OGR84533.1 MAG: cell division protein FtsH [Elusimicrobia bacterium GWF2_52_66]HAF96404.1 cell division protein FtsH [Elusimicrobiota bacterium]HCE98329.1 cell division protein FtsH [Elusimicrobiota bacterium]